VAAVAAALKLHVSVSASRAQLGGLEGEGVAPENLGGFQGFQDEAASHREAAAALGETTEAESVAGAAAGAAEEGEVVSVVWAWSGVPPDEPAFNAAVANLSTAHPGKIVRQGLATRPLNVMDTTLYVEMRCVASVSM